MSDKRYNDHMDWLFAKGHISIHRYLIANNVKTIMTMRVDNAHSLHSFEVENAKKRIKNHKNLYSD